MMSQQNESEDILCVGSITLLNIFCKNEIVIICEKVDGVR